MYLGTAATTGSHEINVIIRVEQLVGSGDSLVTAGRIVASFNGGYGPARDEVTIRLNTAEREDLIRRLSDHRIADIASLIQTT
jgi:hypothetical protein